MLPHLVRRSCGKPHRVLGGGRDRRRNARALGWQIIKRGGYGVTIAGEDGALEIDFRTVPEPKATKNRLHLDIKPVTRGQVDELERLLALGARRVDVGQRPDVSWFVLADPEGNEFCLCRPDST